MNLTYLECIYPEKTSLLDYVSKMRTKLLMTTLVLSKKQNLWKKRQVIGRRTYRYGWLLLGCRLLKMDESVKESPLKKHI